MKPEKKESFKEKILDRYFDVEENMEDMPKTNYQEKTDFSYETASAVDELSITKDPTIISSETVIHGNVDASNDLEISGQVIGDVVTDGMIKVINGSITGNIKADKVLVKNSVINGNIDSHTVVDVVENSEINGNVTGSDVVVDCQCKGNIVANERLKLLENAFVRGDIQTKVIKIDEGANIEGNFKMQ